MFFWYGFQSQGKFASGFRVKVCFSLALVSEPGWISLIALLPYTLCLGPGLKNVHGEPAGVGRRVEAAGGGRAS